MSPYLIHFKKTESAPATAAGANNPQPKEPEPEPEQRSKRKKMKVRDASGRAVKGPGVWRDQGSSTIEKGKGSRRGGQGSSSNLSGMGTKGTAQGQGQQGTLTNNKGQGPSAGSSSDIANGPRTRKRNNGAKAPVTSGIPGPAAVAVTTAPVVIPPGGQGQGSTQGQGQGTLTNYTRGQGQGTSGSGSSSDIANGPRTRNRNNGARALATSGLQGPAVVAAPKAPVVMPPASLGQGSSIERGRPLTRGILGRAGTLKGTSTSAKGPIISQGHSDSQKKGPFFPPFPFQLQPPAAGARTFRRRRPQGMPVLSPAVPFALPNGWPEWEDQALHLQGQGQGHNGGHVQEQGQGQGDIPPPPPLSPDDAFFSLASDEDGSQCSDRTVPFERRGQGQGQGQTVRFAPVSNAQEVPTAPAPGHSHDRHRHGHGHLRAPAPVEVVMEIPPPPVPASASAAAVGPATMNDFNEAISHIHTIHRISREFLDAGDMRFSVILRSAEKFYSHLCHAQREFLKQ